MTRTARSRALGSRPARSRTARQHAVGLAALLLLVAAAPASASATPSPASSPARHLEGTLPSGAAYMIDTPDHWNGTVLLFSHGYRPEGSPNPAVNAPDEPTKQLLLKEGYALVGSSYATTGWSVEQAVPDQLAALDAFTKEVGAARRTLAWGQSLGGLITTTIAERYPGRIDGSLSMCGLVHGGVANWNSTLDATFALRTLLAPGAGDADVRLTGFKDAADAAASAKRLGETLGTAQNSADGRARIALAAALHAIPGWNDPRTPRPAPDDYPAQQANQYTAVRGLVAQPGFAWRAEAERRAGGNMSWNTGVDYSAMLARSSQYKEVKALYKSAGLSLRDDLRALARAPRVSAEPRAVRYMADHAAPSGRLDKPQLTIHTTGDALVPVRTESAYRQAVAEAGRSPLLRQAYTENAGHCTFSPGEQLAAVHTIDHRLTSGSWGDTSPSALNSRAQQADPTTEARYTTFRPGPYPRPFRGQGLFG
ncbi:alpha/beta hydrolase family protein [Streptomyces longisporoflavus]|uniref:Alpha/beta hydrolase family protein n=1 Tax=Streptomyces longisporoflavus TaxID=28044 RepID=A0ABW7QFN7_9ACTN